jgi:colanic acid biosynthesis glycosyl transferase WcaI
MGRLTYVFGTAQLGRNSAVANIKQLSSGGFVRSINVRRTASTGHLFARHRMEAEAATMAVRQLASLNPDMVIGANNPLNVQVQIAKWCRQARKPFIFWLQDLRGIAIRSILNGMSPLLGRISGYYYTSIEHKLLRQSAHVISIANEFCTEVLRAGVPQKRISMVPNWAPIDRLTMRPQNNPWSRSVGLAHKRVLLYTGNLGLKHNPSLFLSLAESVRDRPDVVVAVVSEGLGATWLQSKAKERGLTNLHISPFVTEEVLPDVLGTAQILVNLLAPEASMYSVPSKTWTYLCAGKPIVMSMSADNQAARIVTESGAGICCPPGDEESFVDACQRMLQSSPETRTAMGLAARSFAEANFDLSKICERISLCVDDALEVEQDRN